MRNALTLKGLGATGKAGQLAMAAVPPLVGGGVALASIAIMRNVDPTKSKTGLFVYRNAPWLALGAGAVGALAMGLVTRDAKNGMIAGTAAGLVAAGALVLDKALTGENRDKAAVLAMSADELKTLIASIERGSGSGSGSGEGGTAGLGAYYSTRSLGAAMPQLSATHGISMTPISGQLGYRPFVGGQSVTLNGVVNASAFGTPAFRV